jgi:Malonyl-CoA decarboxylase N-terminal domain/Malonyl-CoA decarboxylase C-terminal domain
LGTALAQRVVEVLSGLDEAAQGRFLRRLANDFGPNDADVRAAFELWTSKGSPGARNALMAAIEGRRQRLFRRINMAPSGTAALVEMRGWLLRNLERDASLREADDDLRHLLVSWFNRGFLEFHAINWQTSADILEKLIAYESVHAVNGWGRPEAPPRARPPLLEFFNKICHKQSFHRMRMISACRLDQPDRHDSSAFQQHRRRGSPRLVRPAAAAARRRAARRSRRDTRRIDSTPRHWPVQCLRPRTR